MRAIGPEVLPGSPQSRIRIARGTGLLGHEREQCRSHDASQRRDTGTTHFKP